MKILVCDTSNSTCCAGIYEDGNELGFELSLEKKTHSETFMPLMDRVFDKCSMQPSDIDLLAVTVGPGSFTGIRIGLSAVKGMAVALGKKVIPVSSLTSLARSCENVVADPKDTVMVPCFDARNDRVFASAVDDLSGEVLVEDDAFSNVDFVRKLGALDGAKDKQFIVVGDGAEILRKVMPRTLMVQYASGAVILPKGIAKSLSVEDAVSGEAVKASYCAVSRAQRYSK